MNRKHGMFAPGTRRRRWRQSRAVSCAIFLAAGTVLVAGGGLLWAIPCFVMAYLDARAYQRGWAISYELPPHGKIQIAHPGLSGDVERRAWAKTQEAAKDPNRPRYAFDKRIAARDAAPAADTKRPARDRSRPA